MIKQYELKGVSTRKLLQWSDLSASTFYYKPLQGRKGIKPSTFSVNQDGELFENKAVIQDIETVLSQEFCCYGYRNITAELKEMGWIINHKKIYRLKEAKLLYGGRICPEPFKRISSALEARKP